MNNSASPTAHESPETTTSGGSSGLILPIDLALIRWSVVHQRWHETANDMPLLQAFLAGWCCRCIGASQPDSVGTFRASFFAGWREADDQVVIASRQIPNP